MNHTAPDMRVRPRWSGRTVLTAAGLTLILFGLVPLAHWWSQPDIDALVALRDVEAVVLPPPVLPVVEPEPQPRQEREPIPIDMPAPAEPRPEPPRMPVPEMMMPALSGVSGPGLGSIEWTIASEAFSMEEIDTPPRPVVQAPPLYPMSARQDGLEGEVALEFVVGVDGTVSDVRVTESRPGTVFVSAARSAVEGWRFEPAKRGGDPVPVRVRVPLTFELDR